MRGKRGFEKLLAIKTIRSELSTIRTSKRCFSTRRGSPRRSRHPNVAQIIDLGEQDEILYLVMEWGGRRRGVEGCGASREEDVAGAARLALRIVATPRPVFTRRTRSTAMTESCSASFIATCRRRTSSSARRARSK